jgi:eukaryotic-like serine/threonine-protein kinase
MTPERWREIERLYNIAREQAPGQRVAFLERTCEGDLQLRQEVESLLNCSEGAEEYLHEGVLDAVARAQERLTAPFGSIPGHDAAGTMIGRYRLLQKIGEGGMGEVWLAGQEEPVRRQVALKLVKAGMNTRDVIARFESERQTLALMDHAAIARVFDAGSTPLGAPYFVMEYVAGIPLTVYCDNLRLSIRRRLELFVHVCEGVQHAHRKAIIHRDLKPSNILVVEVDGRASPKIIDFGIAKALTPHLSADTTFTRAGVLVGTPEYMSPEQANTLRDGIDTRSDVYSLGVIFYELLVGSRPLELGKSSLAEFLPRLRQEEPANPSARIRAEDHATSAEMARNRQTSAEALTKHIRGDLDSIALKALEKDPSRRYGSPSDFAADIERYLNGEAVLAVPPSARYRAGKFVRRHRGTLAAIGAFVVVLILAAAISIGQSIRATTQRNRADREAAAAQAVNNFLQNDLLGKADAANQSEPGAKPDPDLKVRTALDRAAVKIGDRFHSQPEVEAALRNTIGQTYTSLGLYPESRTQLERALDLERRVLGPENPKTLQTASLLGYVSFLEGKYPEAEALQLQMLKIRRRVLGAEHPNTLSSMHGLAMVYSDEGKYPEAETLASKTLEIRGRLLGAEHPDTVASMNELAIVFDYEGKFAKAEALYLKALDIERRVSGPEHPQTLNTANNLALVYYELERYAESESLCGETLKSRRRVLGPDHPDTVSSMSNLAMVYSDEGKYTEAELLLEQTLKIRRRTLGSEHPDTLASMNNLALTYFLQGKYAQAEALQTQTLDLRRRVLGADHPATLGSMHNLGLDYEWEAKYAQASAEFIQTLEIQRRVLGPDHPDTLSTLGDLGFLNQRQGKYALSESSAAEVFASKQRTLGMESPDTISSALDLALAYQSQGKFSDSEKLSKEAIEFYRRKQPDDWNLFRAESLLGASLAGEKKRAEAEPMLLAGYQGMLVRKSRINVPNRYHLALAHLRLVQLYKAWGKPAKAAEWSKRRN